MTYWPNQYQFEELVRVEASSDAGQSVTGDITNLQYEDETIDTHNAWSTDIFIAPRDGVYFIRAGMAATVAGGYDLSIWKNGSRVAYGVKNESGAGHTFNAATVKLNSGDTITFRSDLSITRNTNPAYNYMSITEVR